MRDTCIIKSADKPCGNCLVRINPAIHRQLQDIALKTNRSISSIANDLLVFGLDRVEIVYDDDSEQE